MSTKRTYWIVSLLVLILAAGGANASVLDGLVAYYGFEEGTGNTAADLSGNGHDATLPESGVTWIAEGAVSGAINIDGEKGSDVKLGTWDPAEGTGQMSVAAWVKWGHEGNANQSIISKRDGWSAGAMMFDLRMFNANDNFRIYRAGHPGITSPAGGLTPFIGEWVHLGVSTDGAAASLYVNGEEVQSGEFLFGDKTDAVMRLGSYNNNSPTLNGDLDEVAIWNRMVVAAEMQTIMTGLAAPPINIFLNGDIETGDTTGWSIFLSQWMDSWRSVDHRGATMEVAERGSSASRRRAGSRWKRSRTPLATATKRHMTQLPVNFSSGAVAVSAHSILSKTDGLRARAAVPAAVPRMGAPEK